MVYIMSDLKKRLKKEGKVRYNDRFPEQGRVMDELHKRRKQGKPIDGRCFKDAGQAIEEMRRKGNG